MEIIDNLSASFYLTNNDFFLIIVFIGLLLFSLFILGRENLLTVSICIYIALAIIKFIPELESNFISSQSENLYQYRIILFLAISAALFFLLKTTTISSPIDEGVETWQFIVIGILVTGLCVSIIFSLLPASIISSYSSNIQFIFVNTWMRLLWLIGGLFFIAYLNRQEQ